MTKKPRPKHTNATETCPSCEEKLKTAHPELQEWFNTVVKPKHRDAHISWAWRGKEDQEKAFLDGATKLHFPLSPHNKTDDQGNPCSLALDLFELDYNSIARWAWGYFRDIAKEAQQSKFKIRWGGDFKTLGDSNHYSIELDESKQS